MKRMLLSVVTTGLVLVLAACATPRSNAPGTERGDVFKEVDAQTPGFVEVVLKTSFKKPLPESGGQAPVVFTFDIDGQKAQWAVTGQKEKAPFVKPSADYNQEAGEGIKYVLEKKIHLRTGTHTVVFSLPEKKYSKEFTITVDEGKVYTVELKPVYYWRHRYHERGFEKGISYYEVSAH